MASSIATALKPGPTSELFTLSNRTILVTGGARGLGLTVAVALLESGADVVAFDLLNPEPSAWSAAQSIASASGTQLTHLSLDVTDADAVNAAVAAAFGSARTSHPVRGLFNSAGIQHLEPATQVLPAVWRKLLDVNLTGSFLVSAAFAREYIAGGDKGGASIALVASMSGRVANKGLECAAYNASKAGVAQLARNLAMEWGKQGIRVNSLSPGYIITKLTEALLDKEPQYEEEWVAGSLLGRLSIPEEFRGPVIFMLSDASSFMTGTDLVVDGGHTAV